MMEADRPSSGSKHIGEGFMIDGTRAFSGFSVDDIPAAKAFYPESWA